MMNTTFAATACRAAWRLGWLILAMHGPASHGASLFGDHTCRSWQNLGYAEKRAWTNAFLAPLSLTLKGLHKSKTDPYKDDPKGDEAAIIAVDAFCLNHPELGAADAAGRYLQNLFGMPST